MPNMATLICAGGTGARVLEAVLHLCAAGLGPDRLRTFIIDGDETNGNVTRTRDLVNRYKQCHDNFAGSGFFKTELDLLNSPQGVRVWYPSKSDHCFRDLLNWEQLNRQPQGRNVVQFQDVAELLFEPAELDMKLHEGFRGHPALGAAALALLKLYTSDPTWNLVREGIRADLAQGESHIVIAGSVFGGTGASALHPVARFLRGVPEMNHQQLKIAAIAMAPYFRFEKARQRIQDDNEQPAAKAEWFGLATRSAAQYYEHLRQHPELDERGQPKEWEFDAMYWLGDDAPIEVDYAPGRQAQQNPAHFVELLAAFACLDFFDRPPAHKACYYAGPLHYPDLADCNGLAWEDIPFQETDAKSRQLIRENRKTQLHWFHLVALTHCAFYAPLLADERVQKAPHCVPWYREVFGDKAPDSKKVESLGNFFLRDHFPWLADLHAVQKANVPRVRLFARDAWAVNRQFEDGREKQSVNIKLGYLDDVLYSGNSPKLRMEAVDEVFTATVKASKDAAGELEAKYFDMLAKAARHWLESDSSARRTR